MRKARLAIVGATGAVGIEILRLLEERNVPLEAATLLASKNSVGKPIKFRGADRKVRLTEPKAFKGYTHAIVSAGGNVSREIAPWLQQTGTVMIDNSSAFRMDPDVPLVIPEINAHALRKHKGIIANPNCSTAIAMMALAPLHKRFELRYIIASTYQAVSGSGAKGIEELERQTREWASGHPVTAQAYDHQIVGNAIPGIGTFIMDGEDEGQTDEEMKMQYEGIKILEHRTFRANVTCVRVPVFRAHSIAISATFWKKIPSVNEIRAILTGCPGLQVVDDVTQRHHGFATPLDAAGQNDCFVSRIRMDNTRDDSLMFWVTGDQLLKGAALNAVQILEELLRE